MAKFKAGDIIQHDPPKLGKFNWFLITRFGQDPNGVKLVYLLNLTTGENDFTSVMWLHKGYKVMV